MHGRLKVKTPAEQQEAKRLEREKKISKYKEGMKQLLALRGNDDAESMTAIMKLTGLLLTANSDLYTVNTLGSFKYGCHLSQLDKRIVDIYIRIPFDTT